MFEGIFTFTFLLYPLIILSPLGLAVAVWSYPNTKREQENYNRAKRRFVIASLIYALVLLLSGSFMWIHQCGFGWCK